MDRDTQRNRRTVTLACLVAFLLALTAAALWRGSDPLAGEARSPTASGVDLVDGTNLDCERIVARLLGLEDEEDLDGQQIAGFLLGIEDGDEIDGEQIARLLGVETSEEIDCDRILRLLLGLDDDDELDRTTARALPD